MDRSRQYEISKQTIANLRSRIYGEDVGSESRYLNEGPMDFELVTNTTLSDSQSSIASTSNNELNDKPIGRKKTIKESIRPNIMVSINELNESTKTIRGNLKSNASLEKKQSMSRQSAYIYLFNDHVIIASGNNTKGKMGVAVGGTTKKDPNQSMNPLYSISLLGATIIEDPVAVSDKKSKSQLPIL